MLNIKNSCINSFSTQLLFLELLEFFKTNECFKILIHRFRFCNVSSYLISGLVPNGVTIDVVASLADREK